MNKKFIKSRKFFVYIYLNVIQQVTRVKYQSIYVARRLSTH